MATFIFFLCKLNTDAKPQKSLERYIYDERWRKTIAKNRIYNADNRITNNKIRQEREKKLLLNNNMLMCPPLQTTNTRHEVVADNNDKRNIAEGACITSRFTEFFNFDIKISKNLQL